MNRKGAVSGELLPLAQHLVVIRFALDNRMDRFGAVSGELSPLAQHLVKTLG